MLSPKPDIPTFKFFAQLTPDGGSVHNLVRMRTVDDPAEYLARWRETAEALIHLEQGGKPDRWEETHLQARRLYSFDALIGGKSYGMDFDDLAYIRRMKFRQGFPMGTPPRGEGFDAFMLRLTAALDRFQEPTPAWRIYKKQFSNDIQTYSPADVQRRYGIALPPA